MTPILDRLVPPDWNHVEKFPLRELAAEAQPKNVPVVIGVNWYSNFDSPQKDGRFQWVGRGDLGRIRGGHAVALEPAGQRDIKKWYLHYDQGSEGACVGFGCSRMMSILNRKRYDAFWLYREAQKVDEWPGEAYSGTSVRAALDVLRAVGHKVAHRYRYSEASSHEGVSENRWALNADEVLRALGTPEKDHVVLLNSWGTSYPHRVRMPAETLDRLIREDGEACLVTDR